MADPPPIDVPLIIPPINSGIVLVRYAHTRAKPANVIRDASSLVYAANQDFAEVTIIPTINVRTNSLAPTAITKRSGAIAKSRVHCEPPKPKNSTEALMMTYDSTSVTNMNAAMKAKHSKTKQPTSAMRTALPGEKTEIPSTMVREKSTATANISPG